MTAQGHPRTIFNRSVERGNLPAAELAARELGRITLGEALELTVLVAEEDPGRRSRFGVRWLRRLLAEDDDLTLEEAAVAVSALAALGGRGHDQAVSTLSALAEQATRQPRSAG